MCNAFIDKECTPSHLCRLCKHVDETVSYLLYVSDTQLQTIQWNKDHNTHARKQKLLFSRGKRFFCRAWQSLQDCSTCQAVVVLYKNSCLMHMGVARSGHNPEDALPGPICKRSMSSEQGNYLANLALYPGSCCYTTLHPSLLPCLLPPLPCACSWLCSWLACGVCCCVGPACPQSSTSKCPSSRFVSKSMVFQPVSN